MTASPATTLPENAATTEQRILGELFDLAAEWDRHYHQASRALTRLVGLSGDADGEMRRVILDNDKQMALEDRLYEYNSAITDLHARVAPAAIGQARQLALLVNDTGFMAESITTAAIIATMGTTDLAKRRAIVQPIFEAAGISERLMSVEERYPDVEELVPA